MELLDRLVMADALCCDGALAGVVAFAGAVPEEEAEMEGRGDGFIDAVFVGAALWREYGQ